MSAPHAVLEEVRPARRAEEPGLAAVAVGSEGRSPPSRSAISPGTSAPSPPSITSRSTSSPVASRGSSDRTGPGRARRCARCSGWCSRRRGRASPVATYNVRLDHRWNHEGRNAQPVDKPHPAASSVPAGGTDEDVHGCRRRCRRIDYVAVSQKLDDRRRECCCQVVS
jgi:hypothetical protein